MRIRLGVTTAGLVSAQKRLKNSCQGAAPAKDAGLNRADAAFQDFGDFLVAQASEEVSEVLECSLGTVKSRILRGRRALKEILEPLLGAQQIHAGRGQTSSHGNVSESRPSPFGDAFSAARRFTFSSEGLAGLQSPEAKSPRASSAGEGLP